MREWFETAWRPYYGPEGPGDAETDLRASCSRDGVLPVGLVATVEGRVAGTAALKATSMATHAELTPWLAAFLLAPGREDPAVGDRLIAAVEDLAWRTGATALYAGTGERSGLPEAWLAARGWTEIDRTRYFVGDAVVWRKIPSPSTSRKGTLVDD